MRSQISVTHVGCISAATGFPSPPGLSMVSKPASPPCASPAPREGSCSPHIILTATCGRMNWKGEFGKTGWPWWQRTSYSRAGLGVREHPGQVPHRQSLVPQTALSLFHRVMLDINKNQPPGNSPSYGFPMRHGVDTLAPPSAPRPVSATQASTSELSPELSFLVCCPFSKVGKTN